MSDARRSARIATKYLAAIEGLDAAPIARHGDLSATGAYFETEHEVGPIGTIHWLRLVSSDGAKRVSVMAYVVRRITLLRAEGPAWNGVAFEFMPESDDATTALDDFVHHVHRPLSGAPPRQLTVRSLVLETNWAVKPGDRVRVDVVAPGMTERIRLDGEAVRVAPQGDSGRYTIAVEVREQSAAPVRKESILALQAVRPSVPPNDDTLTDRLDELLSVLVRSTRDRRRHDHLSGMIAQVRLTTLVSLFELERMGGRLDVRRGEDHATIFVQLGQLVAIEPLREGVSARARLAQILAWEDGAFDFTFEPVDRPNAIGLGTTQLLLELARETDEAKG